jgi:lipid II:glycine glycyltransferase (peptidoglycan interpeptide bridge formation enzyme)
MPNHAMQWAMISWAKEQGCTVYDFRGVADEGASAAGAAPSSDPAPAEKTDGAPVKEGKEADNHLLGLNRFKAGFGAQLVDYVGEWDLVLDAKWYWLWTTARPKLVKALKKRK